MNNRIDYEGRSVLLKALANPVRLRIVHGLLQNGCHNVTCMEHGIAIGDFGDGAVGNAGDQHIGFGFQVLQRDSAALGILIHMKLHGLNLTVGNGVDGNGGTGLILHGADITDDIV